MARTSTVIAALIAKHEAAIAKLNDELANAPTEYVPAVGETVEFVFGRAEGKRTLTGSVLAVTPNDKGGPTVTILSGTGADARVSNVLALHVKAVVAPAAE